MFSNAVGEFLRNEVKAGGFKGNCVPHLKDQLRMKSLRDYEGEKRLRMMMIGSNQMGKLREEMNKRCGDKVEVIGRVRIEGENMERDIQGNKENCNIAFKLFLSNSALLIPVLKRLHFKRLV